MKSAIIHGDFFSSCESIKNGGSKMISTMTVSLIKKEVIASGNYRHGERERPSFAIITGANVVGDFTYHIVHVCILF